MKEPRRSERLRKTCPSADSFLMHPLLAELHEDSWSSPTAVEGGDSFAMAVTRRERITPPQMDAVSALMMKWMQWHKVTVCITRRALVDPGRKMLWCVDFVCGIGDRCWLVCLFLREGARLHPKDIGYIHKLQWLAHTRYRSSVGVAAVCIGPDDGAGEAMRTMCIHP